MYTKFRTKADGKRYFKKIAEDIAAGTAKETIEEFVAAVEATIGIFDSEEEKLAVISIAKGESMK